MNSAGLHYRTESNYSRMISSMAKEEQVVYALGTLSLLAAVAVGGFFGFDATGIHWAAGIAGAASLPLFAAGAIFTWKRKAAEQTDQDRQIQKLVSPILLSVTDDEPLTESDSETALRASLEKPPNSNQTLDDLLGRELDLGVFVIPDALRYRKGSILRPVNAAGASGGLPPDSTKELRDDFFDHFYDMVRQKPRSSSDDS